MWFGDRQTCEFTGDGGKDESLSAEKGFELHGNCSCFTSFYVSMFSNPLGPGVQDPGIRLPVTELYQEELRHPGGLRVQWLNKVTIGGGVAYIKGVILWKIDF